MPAGTQRYLAPEVLAGRDADMRTDIWAVGKVLSELTVPPGALSGLQARPKGTSSAPETPILPRGPHARALRKACRENPDERYQHISELKQAFLQPSRRPWIFVAFAIIVAVGIAFALWQSDQPIVQPQQEILSPSPTPRDDKDSFADARNDNSDAVDGKAKSQDASPVTPSEGRRPESRVSPSTSGQPASTKKEATREDIDALFKEATDLFE